MIDTRIVVGEATDVAEVRRLASREAEGLGFSAADVARVALVATEAAGNLQRHAQGGQVLIRPSAAAGVPGIEILALDTGPGIADVGQALRDGYSTAVGSLGSGLGSIRRHADAFELVSSPEAGTALLARIDSKDAADAGPSPAILRVGAVSVAQPGESVCGDAWAMRTTERGGVVLIADGLGHGPEAGRAAQAAVTAFEGWTGQDLTGLMKIIHDKLHGTRGAAVAVADIDVVERKVRFVGAGNAAARIETPEGPYHALVSVQGTAGLAIRHVREFTYEWPSPQALLVLHTDGLSAHWTLSRYPGAFARDPSLVAGLLYRDCWRGRDDGTVVVVKQGQETP